MSTAIDINRQRIRIAQQLEAQGLDVSQTRAFALAGYLPQPKQCEFHRAARLLDTIDLPPEVPLNLGFGGARGPGKTFGGFNQVCDDCTRFPGLNMMILRRTGEALEESIAQMATIFGRWGARLKRGLVRFPNKSTCVLVHYRNPSDIDRHLGQSRDGALIEESTQLTDSKHGQIAATIRSTRSDWRTRIYETTNPGGPGHMRYKRVFIDKRAREREDLRGHQHIQATVDDNRMLMANDPAYVKRLDAMVGWEYRAYRLGDWDIHAGQFFSNFNRKHHVIEPFEVPGHWKQWFALDYGWTHPMAILRFAMDPSGCRYVTREIWGQRMMIADAAKEIKRAGWHKSWGKILSGRDSFAAESGGSTVADQFKSAGVYLKKANDSRIPGWSEMNRRLAEPENGKPAELKIFNTCTHLITQMVAAAHDPAKPGDVKKFDAHPETGEGGDDSLDCARYGLMGYATKDRIDPTRESYVENTTIMTGL